MSSNATKLLQRVSAAVNSRSISLPELQLILLNRPIYLDLSSSLGIMQSSHLDTAEEILSQFEQRLSDVSCYIKLFCNYGVEVNHEPLGFQILQLVERHSRLSLSETGQLDKIVVVPEWWISFRLLFQLRDSAVFLKMWRDESQMMLQSSASGSTKLTHTDVMSILIPKLFSHWDSLGNDLFITQAASLQSLRVYFCGKNSVDCRNELSKLATIKSQIHRPQIDSIHPIDQVASSLNTFFRLERFSEIISALVVIRANMTPILDPASSDKFIRTIMAVQTQYQQPQWTFASISTLKQLFDDSLERFSFQHLDFLAALSSSAPLIQWLVSAKDSQEFTRLLQVTRSSTDEPSISSAMASLVYVRTLLLRVIYPEQPISLPELLDSLSAVKLDGTAPQEHVNNLIYLFDGLLRVFEKQVIL
jgi:hypothetical protein